MAISVRGIFLPDPEHNNRRSRMERDRHLGVMDSLVVHAVAGFGGGQPHKFICEIPHKRRYIADNDRYAALFRVGD